MIINPVYRLHQSFHSRLAAVYVNLSDKEALALGKQHNISAEIQLPSKFQDDVRLTRRLFDEIEHHKEDELLAFNEKMKGIFMKVFCVDVSCTVAFEVV